jgi:hypothetical protein
MTYFPLQFQLRVQELEGSAQQQANGRSGGGVLAYTDDMILPSEPVTPTTPLTSPDMDLNHT